MIVHIIDKQSIVDGFLFVVLLNQKSFLFCHPFGYSCILKVFTQLHSQFVMDGREFFTAKSMFAIRDLWVFVFFFFQFGIFLRFALSESRCLFIFSKFFSFFYHLIYLFSICVIFFSFPNFNPKLFCFFSFCLLIYLCVLLINLLVELSFVILEYSVLFLLFDPFPVRFESPFFHKSLLIYFTCFATSSCLLFSFSFHWFLVYCAFQSSFAYSRWYLYQSILSSFHIQVLYFYADFFGGYLFYHRLVLCLHILTHPELSFGICFNNSLTFSSLDFLVL